MQPHRLDKGGEYALAADNLFYLADNTSLQPTHLRAPKQHRNCTGPAYLRRFATSDASVDHPRGRLSASQLVVERIGNYRPDNAEIGVNGR